MKLVVEDGKILHLRAKQNMVRKEAAHGATKTWHHRERTGKFARKVELPKKVDVEAVSASMKDGVLTVTLLKRVRKRDMRVIRISD